MKILLVDDSKSARYALRLQLQRHGIEVDTADSAESAFELLKGELPDAILMDHMMPGLNGFEALEVIRDDPRTAHLPVVMCTSHEDADFAATAQRKGVLGILPKSGAPEKLPAILAKLRDTIQVPSLAPRSATVSTSVSEALPNPAPRMSQVSPRPGITLPAARSELDEAQILARLDDRIATRITGLLDDLRRDLSERLAAEVQRQIDARLEAERQGLDRRLQEQARGFEAHLDAQRRGLEERMDSLNRSREAPAAGISPAELDPLAQRLSRDVLPSLVKIEIEAERGQIMDLVEQYLRELGPRFQEGRERDAEQLASMEGILAAKTSEVARREAQTAVEAALSRQQQATPPAPQPHAGMTWVYAGILGAALAGIGAAAMVYLLVT